jgi:hypothetical protein
MEIRMHKTGQLLAVMAVLVLVPATPALAQATRTWVSGVGDDANPCSRTAPCKTFAGAISKTATGGTINALDPAGYGAVTITKSITIRSDSEEAGVLVNANNAIIVNPGTTGKVVLDGLDFEGLGTGSNGINVLSAREVLVRNSIIRGFTTGIRVVNTDAANPTSVTIENCTFFNNGIGLLVDTFAGAATVRMYDSLVSGSSVSGIRVIGSGTKVEISSNQIVGNPTSSLSLEILAGGSIFSYGDNVLSPGHAPTSIPKG